MKKQRRNLKPEELPNWLDPKVWAEFVEWRAVELKMPIFEIGERKAIKRLDKLRTGDNYTDIIDQTINGPWRGFFPLRVEPATGSNVSNTQGRGSEFSPDDHL